MSSEHELPQTPLVDEEFLLCGNPAPPRHLSLLIAANKSPGTTDHDGVGGLGLVYALGWLWTMFCAAARDFGWCMDGREAV